MRKEDIGLRQLHFIALIKLGYRGGHGPRHERSIDQDIAKQAFEVAKTIYESPKIYKLIKKIINE